jgi:hypothetical protein
MSVSGVDLNPVAVLMSRTKLAGCDPEVVREITADVVGTARCVKRPRAIQWPTKGYWFTPTTLRKFECLREAWHRLRLRDSRDKNVVLTSLALSVRLCSRADQRSPKPFISTEAREARSGRHFDPYKVISDIGQELSALYKDPDRSGHFSVVGGDVVRDRGLARKLGKYSHIITSPPYINAQDYFRNFKLELYVLEGIVPFAVDALKERFIGTDRGELLDYVDNTVQTDQDRLVPSLKALDRRDRRLGAVVRRYLFDMGRAFDLMYKCLETSGTLVLVCGDNLVGGQRIRTWKVLQEMLHARGFDLVDTFRDQIRDRLLAPKRLGHKGLIKEEVVSAFRRADHSHL